MLKHIIITILTIGSCQALIGFDCGSSNPTIKTFSLIDSGECDFPKEDPQMTNSSIELLQIAEFRAIYVIKCKIEIKRTIFHCGMFSHLGPTSHAVQEYLYEISYEKCKFIHDTGIFKYDNTHTIADLKINTTKSIGIDLAGHVQDKSCTGASYSDSFGSWDNVFVQGLIKVTLLEEYAKVNLKNDKIQLNSGTVCKFSDKNCIDIQAGYSFWSLFPKDNCFKSSYDILYKGLVTKITTKDEIIYTINSNGISFSLSTKGAIEVCNRMLIKTEHPKLFIYEKID